MNDEHHQNDPFYAEASHRLRRASTDDDLLPVVDEHDRVIGALPRRRVHLEGLRHRAVHIGVFDGEGRLWLQQRSAAKDTYGGWWDLSATGHVDPGESYRDAARRELREELGIEAEPVYIETMAASARSGWEFHGMFWLRWPGEIDAFDRSEIDRMLAFPIDALRQAVAGGSLRTAEGERLRLTPGVGDGLELLARAAGLA